MSDGDDNLPEFRGLQLVLRVGGGTSIEINDAAEARSQIAQLVLERTSKLTVYRGGAPGAMMRADSIPELRGLFDEVHGPRAPEPPPSPAPVRAPQPPDRRTAKAPSALPPASPRVFVEPVPDDMSLPPSAPGWRPWFAGLPSSGAAITVFATLAVNVRRAPCKAAPAIGTLARGDAVAGTMGAEGAAGRRWLTITSGPQTGGHVLATGLSPVAPPPIVESARRFRLAAPTMAHDRPAVEAAAVRLPAGKLVQVIGVTATQWAELALPGGSIGYLAPD